MKHILSLTIFVLLAATLAYAAPGDSNYAPKLNLSSIRGTISSTQVSAAGNAGEVQFKGANGTISATSDVTISTTTPGLFANRIYLTQNGGFNTPVITRSDDSDTGISFGTSNEINFNAANATAMTIRSLGNVSIWGNLLVGRGLASTPVTGFDLEVGGNAALRGGLLLTNSNDVPVTLSPTVAIQVVSGTVIPGPCTAALTCGSVQAGAICMASNTTPYICNGTNGWKPVTTGAAVSATVF